ncbi:Exonuclease SbcC [Streptomyces misionensis JCM 4497]
MGGAGLVLAGRGRLRPLRHPAGGPPPLRRGRGVHRRRRPRPARPARRGQGDGGEGGPGEVRPVVTGRHKRGRGTAVAVPLPCRCLPA